MHCGHGPLTSVYLKLFVWLALGNKPFCGKCACDDDGEGVALIACIR